MQDKEREIEITPQMVEAGIDALFASGLIRWNKPRLAVRGAVEKILSEALSAHGPRTSGEGS